MMPPVEHPFLMHLLLLVSGFLLLFGGAFFLMWYYLKQTQKPQAATSPDGGRDLVLPLKLQAFERLVLFLERIHPSNLVMRLNAPDLTAGQLQVLMVKTIREEFEYNLSQQLYISTATWERIRNAKEESILLINQAVSQVKEEADSSELVKQILERVVAAGKLPVEIALDEIKAELKKSF
ncbi:MAG TPA: hypothetical protein PKG48_01335 [Bacteroidales bacterium]|nr:hypothetical protein [Bacteroidales bacterium]HPS63176.1 hypothetical protein [Bacteroidales bacterium]